ncbi:LDCC motif putative metal-binding protein [Caldicoprobacter guelmensis]
MFKKIKKFLEKLAKQNNALFHGQKLNCCELNRQKNKFPNVKDSKPT